LAPHRHFSFNNMKTSHPTRREIIAGIAAASGAMVLGTSCTLEKSSPKAFEGEITRLTLLEASRAVRDRRLSPVELTNACLERVDKIDPRLNSFITVTKELALRQAEAAEKAINAGNLIGPLHGIPIAIKDNIDTAGVRTTAGSAFFKDRIPEKDAEVVRRLKAAGAVLIGKLNLHEFANGATSAISYFGPVHNPWDLERITGGSSGGSAAAVAAGLCFGALGSDTGGSIRIPAGYCGVVGLNPTFGSVSVEGSIPLGKSYDRIGPITRSVADSALLFRALTDDPSGRGFDPEHPASVSKLKVGILPTTSEFCDAPPSDDVRLVYNAALEVIRSLVSAMGETSFEVPDLGSLIDYESYHYHERRLAESPELFQPQTRETLLGGREISAKDAARMSADLTVYRRSMDVAFSDFDLLVLPTNQTDPIRIKDASDPFAPSACTFAFSIAGIPSISVPCGFSKSGLPVGLQIAGPPHSEALIFSLASAYEQRTSWHKSWPAL
jgi:aspartyl-tRNA(Asn)/glutamyl-tRNA(Gln) amidotransferase subunit A